jgi:ABC-type dipeptide/oligopeptide/nickel transport system permease subunit
MPAPVRGAADGDGAALTPRWKRMALRLLDRKPAVAGCAVILLFVTLALAAPLVSPYDPVASNFALVRKAPGAAHWMGTDEIGRDIVSRIVWGTRASLLAGVCSVVIAMGIGIPLGLASGFYRGLADGVVMRLTDAWLSFPFLILAVGLTSILGASLFNATIAIGLGVTPAFIRLTRGQALGLREEEYVQSARAVGAGDARILLRHILPNLASVLIVQATIAIPRAIIAESVLSFLGLGAQPPQPSWGTMLNAAQPFLDQAPWMAWYPGLCIFAIALAFNLAGDGLRDALDPKEY